MGNPRIATKTHRVCGTWSESILRLKMKVSTFSSSLDCYFDQNGNPEIAKRRWTLVAGGEKQWESYAPHSPLLAYCSLSFTPTLCCWKTQWMKQNKVMRNSAGNQFVCVIRITERSLLVIYPLTIQQGQFFFPSSSALLAGPLTWSAPINRFLPWVCRSLSKQQWVEQQTRVLFLWLVGLWPKYKAWSKIQFLAIDSGELWGPH